jgi:hypothetical protein
LYFVSTSDPQINVARVAQRVAQGGHDVDPKKIVDRYHRALSLLPGAVERADVSLVFDNSDVDGEAQLVARVTLGDVEVMVDKDKVPDYYRVALIEPCTSGRPSELAKVREKLQKELQGADLIAGEYSGEIVHVGTHFVAQLDQGEAIFHDTAVLEACKVKVRQGEFCSIRYEHGHVTSEPVKREQFAAYSATSPGAG